jgi:hypothetical protein
MSSPDLDRPPEGGDPLDPTWSRSARARDDEAAFAAMKQHFSEKQIVELTVFCGMWNYSNRLCRPCVSRSRAAETSGSSFNRNRSRHARNEDVYRRLPHCGEVRFEVTTTSAPSLPATARSVSAAPLWSFVPSEHFGLRAGLEDLRTTSSARRPFTTCSLCSAG